MDISFLGALFARGSVDWIIIGALCALIAAESLRGGSNRAVSLALALPLTLFMREALTDAALVGPLAASLSTPLLQTLLFTGILVLVYLLVHRVIMFYGNSSGSVLSALLVGAGCTMLLVITWLEVDALHSLWQFGPQVQALFSQGYRFWWILVSYAALAFARS